MPDEEVGRGADRRKVDPVEEAERQRRHHESRGKKRVALSDLAGELPSDEDLTNYQNYIIAESDRGAAVMAASLVEKALEDAVRSRFAKPEGDVADNWFEGINAPFRTFAAKISLGRALAIYGEHMEARLSLIKNIRNAFAHRMIPLDFSHPTLVEACLKLSHAPDRDKDRHMRAVFASACIALASVLGQYSLERGDKELEVTFP